MEELGDSRYFYLHNDLWILYDDCWRTFSFDDNCKKQQTLLMNRPANHFHLPQTLAVQVKCFQEIISIGYQVYRIHGLPWFRSLSWYFLLTSNYFFYGESLFDYFGVLFNRVETLRFLITYHRFLSFCLYCIGFVWFVLSLVKKYYMKQFSLFAWTHVALLIVVTQSYLIIQNIFEGQYFSNRYIALCCWGVFYFQVWFGSSCQWWWLFATTLWLTCLVSSLERRHWSSWARKRHGKALLEVDLRLSSSVSFSPTSSAAINSSFALLNTLRLLEKSYLSASRATCSGFKNMESEL